MDFDGQAMRNTEIADLRERAERAEHNVRVLLESVRYGVMEADLVTPHGYVEGGHDGDFRAEMDGHTSYIGPDLRDALKAAGLDLL